MNSLLKICLRQIKGYITKYLFLLVVITLGFSLITIMTGYTDSMRKSVTEAGKLHYGGELFLFGSDKQAASMLVIDDRESVEAIIKESQLPIEKIYRRTNVLNTAYIYFNGIGVRYKNIYGIDFDVEYDDFLSLDYLEGDVPSNSDEILISNVTAERLKVNLGDSVTIKVKTRSGQINTGEFIIGAIIEDSGFFGAYRCFMDREELNKLLNISIDSYSSLGLYLPDSTDLSEASETLYNTASGVIALNDPIYKKSDMTNGFDRHWKGVKHFILPLSIYISEVTDLILVMDLISYLVYILIAIIIFISVYVSYNVILRDRSIEFSSMRAIGMQKTRLQLMILLESLILLLIGIIAGTIVTSLVFYIVSGLSFTNLAGFELFLNSGKLLPRLITKRVVVNILLVSITVIPSALIPGVRITKLSVADGLIGR